MTIAALVQGCCPPDARRATVAAAPSVRLPLLPLLPLLLLSLLAAGCAREGAPGAGDAGGRGDSPAVAAAPQRRSPRPPPSTTGLWDADHVEERLDRAGLAPRLDSTAAARQPAFMHVPARVFRVGSAELRVYIYPDSAARARDTDALDPETVAPRTPGTPPVSWPATPTLIVSRNLAAILLTNSAQQRERVTLALEAGLAIEKR
jgi:hypothetical protein